MASDTTSTRWNWREYHRQGKLPPERRVVLLAIRQADEEYDKEGNLIRANHAAIVAAGYLRIHSDGPFWVIPGVPHQDHEVTHWCELGDDFHAPVWRMPQVVGETKRRWHHPSAHGLIYFDGCRSRE